MYLASAAISAGVDFTDASTTFLADDPGNWPPRFIISGFTYDRFEQPGGSGTSRAWDQAARCDWLSRQAAYDAGPYEQAARVFRQHGYTDGARAILIAQRRHARRSISGKWALPRRALDAAFSVTVSYGYRPGRVLWLLAILVILVTSSLLLPGPRAAMRAASSSTVYTTRGPLRAADATRPAQAGPATGHIPASVRGCLRQRPDPLLQSAPVRGRYGRSAHITRSKIDMASRCPGPRRHLHAMVA